ncbi:7283_t:CDS:1, partial [Cetraspora pellucida]
SVDKKLDYSEKLVHVNSKESLMRMKKLLLRYKPDYKIWFWIKSFDHTGTQIYKNEVKLLDDFKKYVNRKGKKKQNKNNFKSKKQSKKKNIGKNKQGKNNFKNEISEKEIISEIVTLIDSRLQYLIKINSNLP